VANSTTQFVVKENGVSGPAVFLFDTLDGTISGWNPSVDPTHAVVAVDNSGSGASYTGLSLIVTTYGRNFVLAADNKNNHVDAYDGFFSKAGVLVAPTIPAGFTPYGVQTINGQIFVTYANPTQPGGYVAIFDERGGFVKTLISGPPLNGPWGLAMAPANFGKFSNDLLVGNVNDGLINAFDPTNGTFLGSLTRPNGTPISIGGLWSLQFGAGNIKNGMTNQLFYTAGPNGFSDGVFGIIAALGVPGALAP
jgi:uncharacterized protein (TIGR03118 family)